MVDYMEILRLSSDPKNSQRCIASIVHSSRRTIRDILEAAKKAGVSWPLKNGLEHYSFINKMKTSVTGSREAFYNRRFVLMSCRNGRCTISLVFYN